MPRIKRKFFHSTRFAVLKTEAAAIGEKNDCTVKALAVALDVAYTVAHDALDRAGRKRGRGASPYVMEKAAKLLGFKAVPVEPRAIIAAYPGAHSRLQSITTHHPERFKRVWANLPPMYLVTARHAVGFRDGRVHDWTEGRAMRVRWLYRFERIEPVAAPPEPEPEEEKEPVLIEGKDPLQVLLDNHAATLASRRSIKAAPAQGDE